MKKVLVLDSAASLQCAQDLEIGLVVKFPRKCISLSRIIHEIAEVTVCIVSIEMMAAELVSKESEALVLVTLILPEKSSS